MIPGSLIGRALSRKDRGAGLVWFLLFQFVALKGNCHQKNSSSYLVVLWLLITMVLFVFLCDDWKWVKL